MMYQRFNHIVKMDFDKVRSLEIRKWLEEQFGVGGYDKGWDWDLQLDDWNQFTFYFINASDYQWFLLRWAHENYQV